MSISVEQFQRLFTTSIGKARPMLIDVAEESFSSRISNHLKVAGSHDSQESLRSGAARSSSQLSSILVGGGRIGDRSRAMNRVPLVGDAAALDRRLPELPRLGRFLYSSSAAHPGWPFVSQARQLSLLPLWWASCMVQILTRSNSISTENIAKQAHRVPVTYCHAGRAGLPASTSRELVVAAT